MKADKQKKVILPPTQITEEQMAHLKQISSDSGEAVSTIIRSLITKSMQQSVCSISLSESDKKNIQSIKKHTGDSLCVSEVISESLSIFSSVIETPDYVRESMFDGVIEDRSNLVFQHDYSLIRNMTTFLRLGK